MKILLMTAVVSGAALTILPSPLRAQALCSAKGPVYHARAKLVCSLIPPCRCATANLGSNNITPGTPGYNKREIETRFLENFTSKMNLARGPARVTLGRQVEQFKNTRGIQ